MEEWLESLKALPWKDWGGAIIGGGFLLMGTLFTVGTKLFSEHKAAKLQVRDQDFEDRKIEHQADVAQTQDLTSRFRALMDGYEARIKDLTAELSVTKQDAREVRLQYERHQNLCRGCPYFNEQMKAYNARSVTPATGTA